MDTNYRAQVLHASNNRIKELQAMVDKLALKYRAAHREQSTTVTADREQWLSYTARLKEARHYHRVLTSFKQDGSINE